MSRRGGAAEEGGSRRRGAAPGRSFLRGPLVAALVATLLALPLAADPSLTERLYLSGRGYGDAVAWQLQVSAGRRSGEWASLPVPSQWEQHGFGSYNYGHDTAPAAEVGHYRHRFTVPGAWRGRRVELVFEGVMTDTEVTLNGTPLRPVHRGGFYRFRYDVAPHLVIGGENLLEVTVAKRSADPTVNRAERRADYWVFGGIFRPVYLEARPAESIRRVAIAARHDGRYQLSAELEGVDAAARLTAEILSPDGGGNVAPPFSVPLTAGQRRVDLTGAVPAPRPWSAEHPVLYRLRLTLSRGETLLHRRDERFGFRTVELHGGRGLFVNGRRVLLKGVARHSFWPESGRTLSPALDRHDAELLKAMNMNAVRTAHYPPDPEFLDACDELGIYVVDELAGWHDAYGTAVGRRLVREMVERDAAHPSVILWSNGNEGGWNEDLDPLFAAYDLERRPVLHPGAFHDGVEARHYPTWEELRDLLDPGTLRNRLLHLWRGDALVLPTELLHGLYDGGGGAGLAAYWELIRSSPRAAGAFLWSFADEAVVRTDRDGALDTDGNHAPDGVLGPHREREGSFWEIRRVWSPVVLEERTLDEGFDGRLAVDNRFDETDLSACLFETEWLAFPDPGGGEVGALDRGSLRGPAVPVGERGTIELPLPERWRHADALRLRVRDPVGREVASALYPIRHRDAWLRQVVGGSTGSVESDERGDTVVLRSGATAATFDGASGALRCLGPETAPLCFDGGPSVLGGGAAPATVVLERREEGPLLTVRSPGAQLRWRLHPSGWLELAYELDTAPAADAAGLAFDYPEAKLRAVTWLGNGPFRVWRNRPTGGPWAVWKRRWAGPEPEPPLAHAAFRGAYGPARWFTLDTDDGLLDLLLGEATLHLGLYPPSFPADAGHATAPFPPGLTLLHRLPAIGSKFHRAAELGPPEDEAGGPYRGLVALRLRRPGRQSRSAAD